MSYYPDSPTDPSLKPFRKCPGVEPQPCALHPESPLRPVSVEELISQVSAEPSGLQPHGVGMPCSGPS